MEEKIYSAMVTFYKEPPRKETDNEKKVKDLGVIFNEKLEFLTYC